MTALREENINASEKPKKKLKNKKEGRKKQQYAMQKKDDKPEKD